MKKLLFILVFILLLNTGALFGQEKTVKGMITTLIEIPVQKAEIMVKSSGETVLTDSLGKFKVTTRLKDKLIIDARGFYKEKVKIREKNNIVLVNLTLKDDDESRSLAIGYGHVDEKSQLQAGGSLSGDEVDFSAYNSMYELIRGRFAGVSVVNGEIVIRGISSAKSSSGAMIIVDGVQVSSDFLDGMSPANVAKINVIKDGTAAIYGSDGTTGVLLIETKRTDH